MKWPGRPASPRGISIVTEPIKVSKMPAVAKKKTESEDAVRAAAAIIKDSGGHGGLCPHPREHGEDEIRSAGIGRARPRSARRQKAF